MRLKLALITAPTTEPIVLATAKAHLRVTATDDDTLITGHIKAVRGAVEDYLGRRLITQTWDYFIDEWPASDYIDIPYPPLVSITNIKYTDSSGTETTWAATNYIVDIKGEPGRVYLEYLKSWPTATLRPVNGIVVRCVAGYGDDSSSNPEPYDVPEQIIAGMKLMLGDLYENREATGEKAIEVNPTVKALLQPYRIFTW